MPPTHSLSHMAGEERLRPNRLILLIGLLALIFLLLMVLAAVRFGPGVVEAVRGALGV